MSSIDIIPEYVALTQNPNLLNEPEYQNLETRESYCWNNGYRVLRPYQVDAIKAVQKAASEGKDRFLLEMATGLGKTLTAGALIQLFLSTENAHRVLFLVDRLELENQAKKNFDSYLSAYNSVIYKQNKNDWKKASIVITTIQSLLVDNKYKKLFSPTDFDLLISDEAHRCIGGNSRAVFEYFIGYKLGLTATPKDYIKNVNIDKLKAQDPKSLERRVLLDTYKTFGCESGEPTFRYSLLDGVKGGYLINPVIVDARTEVRTYINPNPLTLAKEAIRRYDELKTSKSEIWVIFDHDGREREIQEAIDLIKQSRKNIHIAFMKPCIEIWPLLHNDIDNVTSQAAAQSKLEEIMPFYKHDRNPYFDLSKMPNYAQAVHKAKQWEISLSGDKEYNSAKFAGIYKLTEKIKNTED